MDSVPSICTCGQFYKTFWCNIHQYRHIASLSFDSGCATSGVNNTEFFFAELSLNEADTIKSSSLHYKHMTIVNDDSRVISKWCSKLSDNARAVIYYRNMFIIHATVQYWFIKTQNTNFVDRLAENMLVTRMELGELTWHQAMLHSFLKKEWKCAQIFCQLQNILFFVMDKVFHQKM